MFTIKTSVECYLLPEDGDAARALFLTHLEDPYEMWIIAYSFTLVPMIDEILKNNTVGAPYHIYLDLSQSSGAAEKPEVARLVAAGIEVTIGTSPEGTSYITHTKGITCSDKPLPWCWEGSVNFSESGWMQVNTAMFFHSQEWHDAFVAQFDSLRDYAWTNLRADQLMKEPPPGVTIGPSVDANAPPAPPAWQAPAEPRGAAKKPRKTKAPKSPKSAAKIATKNAAKKAAKQLAATPPSKEAKAAEKATRKATKKAAKNAVRLEAKKVSRAPKR
jgi:PLD-like domain